MTETADAPARLRREPAERAAGALLPACAAVWTAAEIMHVAGIPWMDITWGTLTAGAVAYGMTGRKDRDRQRARRHARHVTSGIVLAGAWTAAAVRLGPLAGPYCAMTLTWAGISLAGWLWLRRHEVVVAARDWRNARTQWLDKCRRWGLAGSHLLEHEYTRLGERMVADVKGTGRRASQLAHGDLAERIAEDEGLPVSRVQVRPHRLAGRVEISIRHQDPWANPITHPALAAEPEVDLSGPCTCHKPFTVGQDPESGRTMTIPVWDENGGKRVLVVAITRAGKTVLLNCIRERATAARDVLVVDLNLSKALEDKEWAPACHLTAITRHQAGRALKILRVLGKIIEWRSQQPRTDAVFQPSPDHPLILLIADEIDALSAIPQAHPLLKYIFSKGGSEGVAVVQAGQRGTAEWTGGADVRSQADVFAISQVSRRGEMMHAAGDLGLSMPDMASYGEGHKGVWAIAELGGDMQTGRTFLLKEPADLRKLAEERAHQQPDLEPELKTFLGESYENLLSTDVYAKWARDQEERPVVAHPRPDITPGPAPDAAKPQAAPVATATDALDHLDWPTEDALDDPLRARLAELDRKNAAARRMIEETVAMPQPDISPEDRAAFTAARWRQIGEGTEIPGEAREKLLALLAAGKVPASKAAEALGVTPWTARTYLERLRLDGLAHAAGKGRAAGWFAGPEPVAGGDGT